MIELNVDLLPARIENRGSRILASLAVFFGASFAFLPLAGLFVAVAQEGWSDDVTWAIVWFLLPFALFLTLLLWGINQFLFRLTILVDDNEVRWCKRSLRGTTEVVEPLVRFLGIRGLRRSDSDEGTLYELLLLHPEVAKTVLLYRADSSLGFNERWKRYCRVLGVKPIEYLAPTESFSREIEDLGHSLISLIRDGKLAIPDPGQPPHPLRVEQTATHTVIHITPKRDLIINRNELLIGSDGGPSIPLDEVDAITIEPLPPLSGKPRLMVAFHKQIPADMMGPEALSLSLLLADGLPMASLLWLQRFLLRRLAAYPTRLPVL